MAMKPKPAHLGPHYGAVFEADSVARAYHTRPPFPAELFDTLLKLQPAGPRSILDLGCGTGEVALGLVGRVDQIAAVDRSEAMLRVARARVGGDDPSIRWICAAAESFEFRGPYSLVVAAESLHWMDWEVVLPKVAHALGAGAFLALADGRSLEDVAWRADLARLIARYSTNREYRPYDLVAELTQRGLFRELGRQRTRPVAFQQSIDDYVESFHSRNGFSRERMSRESAAEFDSALRELVSRSCPAGIVVGETVARVVWGRPSARHGEASALGLRPGSRPVRE
jgi:SAM-dependent methyltransferase